MASDETGYLYVGGFIDLDQQGAPGKYYVRALSPADGTERWTRIFTSPTPGDLKLNTLEVDDSGRVFLGGYFNESITSDDGYEWPADEYRHIALFELNRENGQVVCAQTWQSGTADARIWSLWPTVLEPGGRRLYATASFTSLLELPVLGDLVSTGPLDLALLTIAY